MLLACGGAQVYADRQVVPVQRGQAHRDDARPIHRPRICQECAMTNHVYKILELVGSSTTSTDEAIRNAIATAAKTMRNIDWFEVVETRGHVANGEVAHFQVTLKVGFRLET
jgi:flavin-binding protein dodecin